MVVTNEVEELRAMVKAFEESRERLVAGLKEHNRQGWKFDLTWESGKDRDVNSGVSYYEVVRANDENAELLYWLALGPKVGEECKVGGGAAPLVTTRRVA